MPAWDPRPWLRNAGQTLGLGEGSLGSDTTRLVEQQWLGLVGGLDLPHVASWMLTGNGLFSLQLAGTRETTQRLVILHSARRSGQLLNS